MAMEVRLLDTATVMFKLTNVQKNINIELFQTDDMHRWLSNMSIDVLDEIRKNYNAYSNFFENQGVSIVYFEGEFNTMLVGMVKGNLPIGLREQIVLFEKKFDKLLNDLQCFHKLINERLEKASGEKIKQVGKYGYKKTDNNK